MQIRPTLIVVLAASAILLCLPFSGDACTGIILKARDGAVVYGRTMEWRAFDLGSQVAIIPRAHQFTATTPDGQPGFAWQGKYGVVGLDALGKDVILDGMNERGLTAGLFYHPGFAVYQPYDSTRHAESMGPADVAQYLLTTCSTVAEVRAAMARVRVVPVVESQLGFAPPAHYLVAEPDGKAIVIEFFQGEQRIFDAPLGVITNSPTYDWHEINLRNYLNLSAVAIPDRKLADMDFRPLGHGSGMIGLPGDFTPPSRFVRAVAFTQTARPTVDGEDTLYELFRILDNFNVPLGAATEPAQEQARGLLGATLWTSGYDKKNLIMYYHTQHNRRVRRLDLKQVDFRPADGWHRIPLDRKPGQDFDEVTPPGKG